jgi:hypothetical protein
MINDRIKLKIRDLIIRFDTRANEIFDKIGKYFKRFLFPLYLFPIKIITYSAYYLIRALIRLFLSLLKIIWDFVSFPFRSLKNLFKAAFIVALVGFVGLSLFVNYDYLTTHYGWYTKFFDCGLKQHNINNKIKKSVVRIVGGYSEGSGFFIKPYQILTNFHVIADEPSPKIIFPDGSFITPDRIIGDKDNDLAIIFTEKPYPDMVLGYEDFDREFNANEPLFATGYALGTDLKGSATQLKGNYIDYRVISQTDEAYIQADINLVQGMSGGPLTDQCGNVFGVNTITVGGFSLFIPADFAGYDNRFTDDYITKIVVDPAASPEEAVKAFYTYLKARNMQKGFNLLSKAYLLNTNFEEWTNRFTDVIDVDVISSAKFEKSADTVFVKFVTKNWVYRNVEIHFYEGTWKTVFEDGVYKMLKSNIKEISEPGDEWFY